MTNYCGFVAVVGEPNVGKSTLVNHLVGKKISITSDRIQTTRHSITGIKTIMNNDKNNYQFIFVDTPGLEKKKINQYSKILNQAVLKTLKDADIIVWVIAANNYSHEDEYIIKHLQSIKNKPIILAINKSDKIKNKLTLTHQFNNTLLLKQQYSFITNSCLVSAKHNIAINKLIIMMQSLLPTGPLLFDANQYSTRDNNFEIEEIIREKTFRYLGQELPYTLIIEIESIEETKNLIKIKAIIFVTKASHKAIVIGHQGAVLKKISMQSRLDIEKTIINKKVFLEIWVKYRPNKPINLNFLDCS